MAENTEELKECQLCHQMLSKDQFYKRKEIYDYQLDYKKDIQR